jgi:hypothetical protein
VLIYQAAAKRRRRRRRESKSTPLDPSNKIRVSESELSCTTLKEFHSLRK